MEPGRLVCDANDLAVFYLVWCSVVYSVGVLGHFALDE